MNSILKLFFRPKCLGVFIKTPIGFFAFLFTFTFSVQALADEIPLVLFDSERIELSADMQYLKDSKKVWKLQDVIAQEQWLEQVHSSFNFGFTDNAYWLRVRIKNVKNTDKNLIFNTQSELIDFIEFYVLDNNNELISSWVTGDRHLFDSRPVKTLGFVFPIKFKPQETLILYLKVDSHDGLHEAFKPILETTESFIQSNEVSNLVLGAFYGLLLAMFFYNLFLFFSIRDTTYGFYSFYIFVFLIWGFALKGYLFKYLWPNSPEFNHIILAISAAALSVSLTFFLVRYMSLKKLSPIIYRYVMLLAYSSMLLMPFILLDFYALSFSFIFPYILLMVAISIVYTTYLVFKGSREAGFVLASFGLLSISVFIYSLMIAGVIEKVFFATSLPFLGAALEVMFLAFGLADKVNLLQQQNRKNEREARLAQESINEKLSEQVAERTQELEELNNELYRLSVIDELTQVFNRRMFNQQLRKKLTEKQNIPCGFALSIVDIDFFKQYNDHYGHQEGDKILMIVADCMRKLTIDDSDTSFYRVGGEEFAVLVSFKGSEQAIIEQIKSLNQEIMNLKLPHVKSPHNIITISQGLLVLPHNILADSTKVYKQADDLLYKAKEGGRNKTVTLVLEHTPVPEIDPFSENED